MKPPAIRRFIRKVGVENLDDLFIIRKADREGSGKGAWGLKEGFGNSVKRIRKKIEQIIREENALKITDLAISGKDLIEELHLKPSPLFGKILNYLLENVLDNPELNYKEMLIQMTDVYLLRYRYDNRETNEKV